LFFLVIYQLPLLQAALENTAPFDPLPISRRVLWAHSVGPIIFSVIVGFGVALMIFTLNPKPFTQITFSGCCVKTPWDYMELSGTGHVPTITAAWGESYTPNAHPLWRGRNLALYDPFEVGPESSQRFVEYQMRRAVEAVYGIPVATEPVSPEYRTPPDAVGGTEHHATKLEDVRGRMSADRNRTAAVALIVLAILTTALMINVLLQFGRSVHRKFFKWISSSSILTVIGVTVVVFWGQVLGLTEVWCVGALISIGIRFLSHALPFSTPILWILCVTFWAGAYLILERVFCTIEFPREKTMNRFAEVY
jgi:hypothetical protein